MDRTKNYSLFTDGITDAVADFISKDKSLVWTVSNPTPTQYVYRISRGDENGVITFYIKKSGLVSINPQGGLVDICNQCCDYVIDHASIPNSQRKSFSLKDCIVDNYDYFKEELSGLHKYTVSVKGTIENATIKEIIAVECTNHGKIVATLYKNGTFLMQGNVTPVFVGVMTEAIRWLLDANKASKVSDIILLDNITNVFSTDIDSLIPNLNVCGDTDNVILRMVMTSVSLFNSGVLVDDYGCYTFGILKALEGLLKMRLEVDLGLIDKLGSFFDYDDITHSHRIRSNVYDGNLPLKMAINKTYNYWNSRRHASFHADSQISTSTLYSYEDALAICVKGLECINDICDNW